MPKAVSSVSSMQRPRRLSAVKMAPNVGEHFGGEAVLSGGVMKRLDDVGALGGAERPGGDRQPRVVVEHVEDLDVAAVGERPMGGVGLPALVGELGAEAPEARLGPLLRLR